MVCFSEWNKKPAEAIGRFQDSVLRTLIRGLSAFDRTLLHPRHQRAETSANFFDGMLLARFKKRIIFLVTRFVLFDPTFGKFSRLDLFERLFHPLLHSFVHNL